MACAFPAARCTSSMKSVMRGRSSFKRSCRYFRTIQRKPWRPEFSRRSIGSIRARFSSMLKDGSMLLGEKSWWIDSKKMMRKYSSNRHWKDEKGQTRHHLSHQASRERRPARVFSFAYTHRAVLSHLRVGEVFLHCTGARGLSGGA